MSKKLKAFGSCIGFAMIAYGAYTYQAYDPMKVCIAVSALCLIWWTYKVIRDLLPPAPPPIQEPPQARNSANNRLFVPPAKYK
jgi:hypothetical protein